MLKFFKKFIRNRRQPDELDYALLTFHRDREPVGRGVSGAVYKSTWKGVTVAMKDMQFISSQQDVDNEKKIMKILKEKQAPNIVKYIGYADAGWHMNGCCIVMEYVPSSLTRVIELEQPFEWPTRYSIMCGLLSGIAFMHQLTIVHRDIKGKNVLLTSDWQVKLCDFGLAKIIDNVIQNCGTPGWMAPEISSAPYTTKADVYSAAVTMREIAIWSNPIRFGIPHDCPPKLAELIISGRAEKPEDRPTAEEMLERVRALN